MKNLLLVLCISLVAIDSPFQATTANSSNLVMVRGKVLQKADGSPIRKANVQLNGWTGHKPTQYSAITDAEGKFTLAEIEPGKYFAVVEHPEFVPSPGRKGQVSITVGPAGIVQPEGGNKELILYMERAAIITGKIVDLDGDAMRDVSVSAVRDGPHQGGQGPHSFGGAGTNDLGEFRISGLRAGRYKITAAPRQATRPGSQATGQPIYLPTYYPGVLSQEQAVAVEIRAGTETRIDFGVLTGRAYSVSGSVTGLSGRASMAQLMLEPTENGGSQPPPRELGESGKFEFDDVLPGRYSVRLITVTFDGGKPGMQMLSLGQPIDVGNANVEGLVLQPEPGGQVSGKFRMDTEQKFDWTQLQVMLVPLQGDSAAFGFAGGFEGGSGGALSGAKLSADGTFDLGNLPGGTYQLLVAGDPSKLADYFTKTVSVGGNNVSDSGFQVAAKTYLDVVVSANGASITGKVVDDQGQPVANANVVDVPSAEHRKRFDVYQRATSDGAGNFSLRGLAPGKYSVFAFEVLQEDVRGADFLKSYEGCGEQVQLEQGTSKSVMVKVIPNE